MTSRDDMGALLAAWFDEDSTMKAPPWLLPATLARTSRAPRRPRWLSPGRWLPLSLRYRRAPMLVPAVVILLALLLLALVAASIGTRPRLPDPLGVEDRSRVVLVGSEGIVSVAEDGSDRRVLTAVQGRYGFPTWSPDASQIAVHRYTSPRDGRLSGDLLLVSATGGAALTLESDAEWLSAPSWSLDGRTLAYSTFTGDVHRVVLAAADGSGTRLLGEANSNDWSPAFSPDGTRIAFVRQSGRGDPGAGDAAIAPPMDLHVMGVDGSNPLRLSRGDFDWFDGSWLPFQWSPDGTSIVFTAGAEGSRDIFVVSTDGALPERRLTTDARDEGAPAWSPDGGSVAFYRYDEETPSSSAALVLMNVATGKEIVLHTSSVWTPPRWTRDGRVLAATLAEDERIPTLILLDPTDGTSAVPIGPGAMAVDSGDQPGLVEPVSLQGSGD